MDCATIVANFKSHCLKNADCDSNDGLGFDRGRCSLPAVDFTDSYAADFSRLAVRFEPG